MNHHDYRESKINKYPDNKTGILWYKHEKLFDIVKTIEDFVNISLNGEPSIEEYKRLTQTLLEKLPEEYKVSQGEKFDKYLRDYEENLCSRNRYGATEITSTDNDTDLGSHTRNTKELCINYNNIQKSINSIMEQIPSGALTKEQHKTIEYKLFRGVINSTTKHEFMHYLNNTLLHENANQVIEEIKRIKRLSVSNTITTKELLQLFRDVIKTKIKDEFIAMITDERMTIGIIKEDLSTYYLKTIMKSFNDIVYIPIGDLHNYGESLIEEIGQQYQQLKTYTERYYTHPQLIYLLAFTPLSGRQSLLDYYKKLNSLDQTPADLHSTLSQPHDD